MDPCWRVCVAVSSSSLALSSLFNHFIEYIFFRYLFVSLLGSLVGVKRFAHHYVFSCGAKGLGQIMATEAQLPITVTAVRAMAQIESTATSKIKAASKGNLM